MKKRSPSALGTQLEIETLDFLLFNVFLEDRHAFRRYLTRLHHLAGDRPLVLGELGMDSSGTPAGEAAQAEALATQLETAMERGVAGTCAFSWTDEWWVGDAAVEGWHFGLTRADRSAKPALQVARRWNERTVADLRRDVYAHLLSLSPSFFEVTKTGEVLSRLTTDIQIVENLLTTSISVSLSSVS